MRFIGWLLKSALFQEEFYRYGKGIVADLWSTNFSEMRNIVLAMPPVLEQSAIAAFLDLETGKIDALVAEQERLIALLKEKRQAVISQAVTKGLNPNAPMKDSGIEWLGQVPAHWRLTPLRYIASFMGGGTPNREIAEYWGGDIPWVSPKDMKSEIISDSEEKITGAGLAGSATSLLQPDAVLLVVRSGILKHTIPVAINSRPVALNQDMKAIRLDRQKCLPPFLKHLIQGMNQAFLNLWLKQGATVESIEHNFLVCTPIPLAPVEEQSSIVAFLDKEIDKIESLITKATQAITLLRERRAALISAAVTGKIDVRTLALSQPEAA
jgi:type I restriction enzyme S subunit